MENYDITFLGHMCYDEIIHYNGEITIAPGSAVLCGAITAARIGKRVAAIVKMMEAQGPFSGSVDDVLGRMREQL